MVDKFYLSTNLPIRSFQYDGHHIHSMGYNDSLNRLFDRYDVYEKALQKISQGDSKQIVHIPCFNNIYFTASSACPKNIYRGIFIIGPYSTKPTQDGCVPYKPSSVIPYLVSLLGIIWRDCPRRHNNILDDQVYSLHIKKAIDYIESRYRDNINLTDVSNYLEINKSYFCSLFKEETSYTFTGFLNKIRIEKSKELLLRDDLSILDIALMVGFNSQNYYNIIFKRITNETPLEFRRNNT